MIIKIFKITFILALYLTSSPTWAKPEPKKSKASKIEENPWEGNDNLSPIDGVKGHLGFGYFTGFAPLGVRYWLDRKMGIDIGIDGAFSSGNLKSYRAGLEVGGIYALGHYHYSVVFTRLGLGFKMNDSFGENSSRARYDINGNLFLGAELFLGAFGFPNVSLQGGYGLQASWTVEGGTTVLIGTTNAGLNIAGTGTVGFHIYL